MGHRGLDRGFHGDHGHGIAGPQDSDRRAGGRIAGHHQGLGVTLQQEFGDGDGAGLDGLQRLVPIGGVRRVRHIEQVLMGQFAPYLAQDGEPAHAGIEDPDGSVS